MGDRLGLLRSLLVYWRPGRQPGLRRLYAQFVGSGDLVFDIGAHLGDRSAAFAALGATVVAVEPQPEVARWLRRLVGRNPSVQILEQAVGATPGTARLAISRQNPTVSTLSTRWRERVAETNPGFKSVRWEAEVNVEVVTLDQLIARHGVPSFCKIDVEGFEAEVLAGLSRSIPALSVEFVQGDLGRASACIDRLNQLAPYSFNVIRGERREFEFSRWQSAEEIERWIQAGASGAASGDIYARLEEEERT